MKTPNDPIQKMAPEQKAVVATARIILADERFEQVFKKMVDAATSFGPAAASIVFVLLQKAQEQTGQIPAEMVYGDGGAADAIADSVYAYASQHMRVEGSEPGSPEYDLTMDLIDEMGQKADAPQEEGAPPEQPAPGPRPVMSSR